MGSEVEEEEAEAEEEEKRPPDQQLQQQKKNRSLKSKAALFVSDLTTVIFNPISDSLRKPGPPPLTEDRSSDSEKSKPESDEEGPRDISGGPDTSSFTAFLYSLLLNTKSGTHSSVKGNNEKDDNEAEPSEPQVKEPTRRRGILSRGKHTIGRAFYQFARLGGSQNKGNSDETGVIEDKGNSKGDRDEEGMIMKNMTEGGPLSSLPEISEPSYLLSEKTRMALYAALPVIVKDRNWVMLYSTWRNGISLSTLYRRSMLWPGLSLLVVGDRDGTVFGGLVEAPLRATTKRRYQGTNASFVFTNVSGHPIIFRPTGVNRYYTMCSTEYLALGGGGHFALYLDGDLMTGSSAASETYGNPCLSSTEDFVVKEVELWGFVYASKYEEIVSLLRTEVPGICRW
ncbi:unnamed protein product [Cuscuta campestris]|uniref:Oxidation resistance protein 1 n=1 Tax=Cuscuta campestris TaxID=132261 RepID=A0A484KFJ8_9ASTE|nr:unnamed protein product [Cuscuta campestris]